MEISTNVGNLRVKTVTQFAGGSPAEIVLENASNDKNFKLGVTLLQSTASFCYSQLNCLGNNYPKLNAGTY